MRLRTTTLLLTAAALLLAGGCSPQFQSDWKRTEAAEVPGRAPADHLSGRWKGSWKSDKSGHGGGPGWIVTRPGGGKYKAHLNAPFMGARGFRHLMDNTAAW